MNAWRRWLEPGIAIPQHARYEGNLPQVSAEFSMKQFPAWRKLARSEIQIGPDQHDIAVGVTVAGVKLRTCPLLNFRSERAKHLQKIFRHHMARAEVLKSSISNASAGPCHALPFQSSWCFLGIKQNGCGRFTRIKTATALP
jgi:hypothetical protein